MRTALPLLAAVAALAAAPTPAAAQAEVETSIRSLLPALPPLVVVQPPGHHDGRGR